MSYLNMLSTITWKGSDGDTVSELVASESGFNTALDQARKVVIQVDETIHCQQLVLDQIAEMLGVEKGDVDGIGAAIEGLKRKTTCMIGVGDGTGAYFVNGDYESIKMLQGKLMELEQLRRGTIDKALAAGEVGNGSAV